MKTSCSGKDQLNWKLYWRLLIQKIIGKDFLPNLAKQCSMRLQLLKKRRFLPEDHTHADMFLTCIFSQSIQFNLDIKIAIQLLMSSMTSKYKSTPTFSFKGRNKSITTYNDPSVIPSPHQYNPQKVSLRKSPSTKFTRSTRKEWDQVKCKETFPGPGSHQSVSFTTSGLKKTISKVLFLKTISQTPSPNHYNPNLLQLKKKEPSFTMQSKTISMHNLIAEQNNYKPSPVNYETIAKFKSSGSITIGKSLRKSFVLNQINPGPGAYEAEKSFRSSVLSESKSKIGKQIRKIDFSKGQKTPGPGSYQDKSFVDLNKLKQKGYSCRPKFLIESPSAKVPGPGQYEAPLLKTKNSAPIINIPKQTRISFTERNNKLFSNNPGPGSFDIEGIDRVKFRSMSVHKFSKQKSNYLSDTINSQSSKKLSPGYYNANQLFTKKSSPKFSISLNGRKQLFGKIGKAPGPTQYTPKANFIHSSELTHTLQKSQRPSMIKHLEKIPGPGQYQTLNQDHGMKFKFSKERRGELFESKFRKQKSQHQTYQERQQFPNPPKYMSVIPKLKYEEKSRKK